MTKFEIAQFAASNIIVGAERHEYLGLKLQAVDAKLEQSVVLVEDTAPCALQGLVVLKFGETRGYGFLMRTEEKPFVFVIGFGDRDGSTSFVQYREKTIELEARLNNVPMDGFRPGVIINLSPKVAAAVNKASKQVATSVAGMKGLDVEDVLKKKEAKEDPTSRATRGTDGSAQIKVDEAAIIAAIEVFTSMSMAIVGFATMVKNMGILEGLKKNLKTFQRKVELRAIAIRKKAKN